MGAKDINFDLIVTTALLEANNKDRLKSYLTRQSKIAEEHHYTLDDFSDRVIRVVNGKLKYLKHIHGEYLKELQSNIDNIDNLQFEFPLSKKSYSEYTSEELEQIRNTQRKKYLEGATNELNRSKISDYNKNEYGRLENIIEVIDEISGKGSKHKKQMNLDRLDNLMNQAFRKQFDRFKSDLREFVPNYSKMQISALASIIYDSDILHKNTKPKDFKNWQKQFCDILGVEESTYKKSNIKKEEKEKMKKTYYYLFG
jgi:hypothetical protein